MNIIKDIEKSKYPSLIPYKSLIKELLKLDDIKAKYGLGSLEFQYTGELDNIPFCWNEINFILDKYTFAYKHILYSLHDESKHYSYEDDGLISEDHELDFNFIEEILLEIKSNDKIKMIIFRFIIDKDQSEKIINKFITDEYNNNKQN